MSIDSKTAVIFGGTGFVGRQVVRDLAKLGMQIKVATRIPESAYFLKPAGAVGQIVPVACDYTESSIKQAIAGCDYVVNCVGILYEKRKGDFQRAHVDFPKRIATVCAEENIKSFVHISALACERGTSKYAHTKLAGEQEVLQHFPKAVILRPSVIFGEDDRFFNMFAELSRYVPFLPLIGGGHTKFQPVYVGDVARAVVTSLTHKEAQGHIFELAGPETVSFRDIYKLLMTYTKRRRSLVTLPYAVAKLEAAFLQLIPNPLLTTDQVESLKTDNVMNSDALGLKDLGIEATMMTIVLPKYLERYQPGGGFASHKAA